MNELEIKVMEGYEAMCESCGNSSCPTCGSPIVEDERHEQTAEGWYVSCAHICLYHGHCWARWRQFKRA